MAEESKSDELDLSNLDSLLTDLEKNLPDIEKDLGQTPAAASAGAEMDLSVPDLPDPVPVAPAKTVVPAPVPEDPKSISAEPDEPAGEELMASPLHPAEKDDPPDNLEEMFTDEEESEWSSGSTVNGIDEEEPLAADAAPVAAEPAVKPAPPADEDTSFEDALEIEEPQAAALKAAAMQDMAFEEALEAETQTPPEPAAVTPAAPPTLPGPRVPAQATAEEFRKALLDRKYDEAVQIGKRLQTPDSPPVFRINLAGALFYSGRSKEAEQELLDLLKQAPYNISARRNLEVVRSGKS